MGVSRRRPPVRGANPSHWEVATDPIWFHGVGILLDFAAGFLLAPELIGSRRLGRLEMKLEAGMLRAEDGLGGLAALVPKGQLFLSAILFILSYVFSLIAWTGATLLRLEAENLGPPDLVGFAGSAPSAGT